MPIIAGVGIAIKALEVLAAGRAIVASPLGFRGLPPDFQPPAPKPRSDACEFAAAIDRLLSDEQARDEALQSRRKANQALGMRERFESQMAQAVERLANCAIS